MPDLSGFEVAQRLKSNPDTADIPIIFLTALNSTTDIVKEMCIRDRANDYNPNVVAPPEMKLLELSIWEDGFTMPCAVSYTHLDVYKRQVVRKAQ